MNLQSRRRFLDAMGLGPAWTLRRAPHIASAPESVPFSAPVSQQAIAAMNWIELAAAAASCTRCDLCRSRSNTVFGRGATDASLIVLGGAPDRVDEEAGAPVGGAPGQLLDNMLRAIDLAPQQVYVTNLVKCRPPAGAATAQQLSACRPYLERELTLLTQARTLLALGLQAEQSALPAGALGAFAVVATLHPDDVLRSEQLPALAQAKARVWVDLCLAKDAHAARA